MLEGFRKGGAQAAELQALVASSREERAALSTMLTQIQRQSSKLAAAAKALQNVDELVDRAAARLDTVTGRLDAAEARARDLEAIGARIDALGRDVGRIEAEAERLVSADGTPWFGQGP